jgi:hypothetical protein
MSIDTHIKRESALSNRARLVLFVLVMIMTSFLDLSALIVTAIPNADKRVQLGFYLFKAVIYKPKK